ncbi:hypothetical protein QBC46DRAFT_437238 [Diplogelasinospora grovesii]|uniref:Uncharacterized protein n=1 Tax=Diplogelasinospora grovesii TaxID=303347 RepID=A0AAN6N5D3_9PEZI|nr:hypothetical protein QBC46DRAFT_437238 [Diplogelasinospora grovesii]
MTHTPFAEISTGTEQMDDRPPRLIGEETETEMVNLDEQGAQNGYGHEKQPISKDIEESTIAIHENGTPEISGALLEEAPTAGGIGISGREEDEVPSCLTDQEQAFKDGTKENQTPSIVVTPPDDGIGAEGSADAGITVDDQGTESTEGGQTTLEGDAEESPKAYSGTIGADETDDQSEVITTENVAAANDDEVGRSTATDASQLASEIATELTSAGAPLSPLRDYLEHQGHQVKEAMSCRDVLVALIGQSNFNALEPFEKWETELLACPVSMTESDLQLMADVPLLSISKAELALEVQSEAVGMAALVSVTWNQDCNLSVEFHASLKDGTELDDIKVVEAAWRRVPLGLAASLLDASSEQAFGLEEVMAQIEGDVEGAGTFTQHISPLFEDATYSGGLVPDQSASELKFSFSSEGVPRLESASIFCPISTQTGTQPLSVSVGKDLLSLSDVRVWYHRTGATRWGLQGKGTVRGSNDTRLAVHLEVSIRAEDGPSYSIRILDTPSLTQILELFHLPALDSGVQGPFRGMNSIGHPRLEETRLDLTREHVETANVFSHDGYSTEETPSILETPIAEASYILKASRGFRISGIAARIPDLDVTTHLPLPQSFQLHGTENVTAEVEAVEPQSHRQRTINIAVDFAVRVHTDSAPIKLRLSGLLKPGKEQYEHRLTMLAADNSASAVNVAECLGLGDLTTYLDGVGQLFGESFESVYVKSFQGDIVEQDGSVDLRFWSLSLKIERLNLVRDVFAIQDCDILITGGDEAVNCEATGYLVANLAGKPWPMPVRLPRIGPSTTLELGSGSGLSLRNLSEMSGLNTGVIQSLPFTGTLLDLALDYATLTINQETSPDVGQSFIATACVALYQDAAALGPLHLCQVSHLIEHRNLAGQSDPGTASYHYHGKAQFGEAPLSVSISYDTVASTLALSLEPTSDISIADVLQHVLPGKMSKAVVFLFGHVPFHGGQAILDPVGYSVREVLVDVKDANPVKLGQVPVASSRLAYTSTVKTTAMRAGSSLEQHLDTSSGSSRSPSTCTFAGVIGKDSTKAHLRILFPSSVADAPETLEFEVTPLKDTALDLLPLLALLGLPGDKLHLPSNVPSFSLKSARGHVSLGQQNATLTAPSLSIDDLLLEAETVHPMVLLQNVGLKFDTFRVNARYHRMTGLVGTVEARLALGTSAVWMALSVEKEKDTQHYRGEMDVKNLNITQLATALRLPSSYEVPKIAGLDGSTLLLSKIRVSYTSGKCIEIIGAGTSTCSLTCSGVSLNISEVGGHFKYTNGVYGSKEASIEGYITGNLLIPGFMAAQARLRLSQDNCVMTAVLQAASDPQQTLGGLELIADFLGGANSSNSGWGTMVPRTAKPMAFDKTGVALQVDFSASKIVALGVVNGVGSAVVIAKTLPSGQPGCYVSLAAHDLTCIWPDATRDLASFTISDLAVEVLNFQTTAKDLGGSIKSILAEVSAANKLPKQFRGLTTLAPETVLLPGAWCSATISMGGTSEMTKALTLGMSPDCKPIISLYAKLAQNAADTVYSVTLENFVLIGGKIAMSGVGRYTPANQQLTFDGKLVLTGFVEQPLTFDVALTVAPGQMTFTTLDHEQLNSLPPTTTTSTTAVDEQAHHEPKRSATSSSSSSRTVGRLFGSRRCAATTPDNQGAPINVASAPATIGSLFGGKMFGIELTMPKFKGSSINQDGKIVHTQVLTAGIRFGDGHADPAILGSIVFDSGRPQVAAIDFKQSLSIEDIFAKIISPGSKKGSVVAWPKQLPPLILNSAKIYYLPSKDKLLLDGFEYLPGYHLDAEMSFFDRNFKVSVELPESRKGVVIAATYLGDINLQFAQILSPKLAIDTAHSKTTFAFDAGLTLFGVDNLHLHLDYQIDSKSTEPSNCFSGMATYKGDLFGVHNPSIPFNSDGSGNFKLPNWEVCHDGDGLFDLADAIMKASVADKTCSCGALEGLEMDGVKTKFNFALSLAHDRKSAGNTPNLAVVATASLSFGVLVGKTKAASLGLGQLQLSISAPFNKEQLGQSLVKSIKESAASVGKALLEHPEEFAKVIALINVKKFSKQLTQRLICRKVKPKNLVQHGLDFAEHDASLLLKGTSSALSLAHLALKVIPTPGLPIPGPGALAAYGTAFVAFEAAGAAVAAVGTVGSIVGLLLGLPLLPLSLLSLGKKRDKAKEEYKEAEKAIAQAKKSIEGALVLHGRPRLKFVSDDTVELDWSENLPHKTLQGVDFKEIKWSISFLDPTIVATERGRTPTANGGYKYTVTHPDFAYSGSVDAWIRGSLRHNDKYEFHASRWSRSEPAVHVPLVHPPESVQARLDLNEAALTVDIRPLRCYEVQVVGQSETVLLTQLVNTDHVVVKLADLAAPGPVGTLTVKARCVPDPSSTSDKRPSLWVSSAPVPVAAGVVFGTLPDSALPSPPESPFSGDEDAVSPMFDEAISPGETVITTPGTTPGLASPFTPFDDPVLTTPSKEIATPVTVTGAGQSREEPELTIAPTPVAAEATTAKGDEEAETNVIPLPKQAATNVTAGKAGKGKEPEVTIKLMPSTTTTITSTSSKPGRKQKALQNSHFQSGNLNGWTIDLGATGSDNAATLVRRRLRLFCSSHKLVATIPPQSMSVVCISQSLDNLVPGRVYRATIKGRFVRDTKGGCVSLMVDGVPLFSLRSTPRFNFTKKTRREHTDDYGSIMKKGQANKLHKAATATFLAPTESGHSHSRLKLDITVSSTALGQGQGQGDGRGVVFELFGVDVKLVK